MDPNATGRIPFLDLHGKRVDNRHGKACRLQRQRRRQTRHAAAHNGGVAFKLFRHGGTLTGAPRPRMWRMHAFKRRLTLPIWIQAIIALTRYQP